MTPFTSFSDSRALASCWSCHMEVLVNSNPMPNEIDIGGEAVALDCPGSGREPKTHADLRESRQNLRNRLHGG